MSSLEDVDADTCQHIDYHHLDALLEVMADTATKEVCQLHVRCLHSAAAVNEQPDPLTHSFLVRFIVPLVCSLSKGCKSGSNAASSLLFLPFIRRLLFCLIKAHDDAVGVSALADFANALSDINGRLVDAAVMASAVIGRIGLAGPRSTRGRHKQSTQQTRIFLFHFDTLTFSWRCIRRCRFDVVRPSLPL